ncbi:mechanosensitive ion channel family protein [Pelotalea chapellei]|uniref:Mechanosensitive ion channel family protein n=1 Tax=Pelotalea chapellei TaxID=44671 RepID=A0ABS5U3U3_9BACT|nr:mechanosensitive ion channel family protein [Pelotalea chapellei]MBT1070340.1 mechanosensitive ion channel family protein [Pelotalea chapellei]
MGKALTIALERLQEIAKGFAAALPSIALSLVTFVIFYMIGKMTKSLVKRATERRSHMRGAGIAMGRIAQGLVLLVGTLIALSVALPTFKPGDVIELLGIGSVAIGFAFRDILQNFLAGILILLTHPYRIGDQIVTSNYEGTVEDIQTRATFIRTYDGRRVVIPNSNLFTEKVVVNTAFDERRIEYDIGIGYGDDVELAKRLMLEAMHETDGVLKEPAPDVLVMEFAPSSLTIRARWWISPPRRADALDARDAVLSTIKKKLKEHGVDTPFPTQQILFHDQTEETDGDRQRQREGWPVGMEPAPRPSGLARTIRETTLFRPKDENAAHPREPR